MLKISYSDLLSSHLTRENKADPEALRIIEVTALARIADLLRELSETAGTRF